MLVAQNNYININIMYFKQDMYDDQFSLASNTDLVYRG